MWFRGAEPPRLDFVVGGAQKSGTTSLMTALASHPEVGMAPGELHMFDDDEHFDEEGRLRAGLDMPRKLRRLRGRRLGETTPHYLYKPECAERIRLYNPRMRLIFVLRNPVARAYSSWNMQVQKGREELTFEDALAAEDERIKVSARSLKLFSYAQRGFYVAQLERYFARFPGDQIRLVKFDNLVSDPASVMRDLCTFLDVSADPLPVFPHANARPAPAIEPRTARWLGDRFAHEFARLEALTGWELNDWRAQCG